MTSNEDLLHAWREGKKGAGKTLVDRFYDPLARFFSNKVGADIDDLVQETLFRCVKQRDRIELRGKLRAYLFGIAFNVLRAYMRRKYNAREEKYPSWSLHDIAPGQSTMLREREQDRQLLEALRKLSFMEQTVLEMQYWEKMTCKEIGLSLGLKEATVRSHQSRGRKKLKALLEQ